jgi:hypothetical protein
VEVVTDLPVDVVNGYVSGGGNGSIEAVVTDLLGRWERIYWLRW